MIADNSFVYFSESYSISSFLTDNSLSSYLSGNWFGPKYSCIFYLNSFTYFLAISKSTVFGSGEISP